MFYLSIILPNYYNPTSKRLKDLVNHNKDFKLFGNKRGWIQIDYFGFGTIFAVGLDLTWSGCNHAGGSFAITVLGFTLELAYYDVRHWDDENNKFLETGSV
jgi:hypothetical protein